MNNSSDRKIVYDSVVDFIDNTPVSIRTYDITHQDMHYHMDSIELIYCIEGSITIICNHETLTLNSGEMFTINQRDCHCIFSEVSNTTIIMHLNMHDLEASYDYLEGIYFAAQDHAIQKYQMNALAEIKSLILALTYETILSDKINSNQLRCAANRIINLMTEYFDWFSYMHFNESQIEILRDRFKQMIKYCHIHYRDKITITELADLVHLNTNYTSQFLGKSSYGSFNGMMAYIRCYESQYLLLNTNLPLDEVSILCGFSDTKYFYKNFNIWWCKKPKELRDWFKVYSKSDEISRECGKDELKTILIPHIAEFFTALKLG